MSEEKNSEIEMLDEYDFSHGVGFPFAARTTDQTVGGLHDAAVNRAAETPCNPFK